MQFGDALHCTVPPPSGSGYYFACFACWQDFCLSTFCLLGSVNFTPISYIQTHTHTNTHTHTYTHFFFSFFFFKVRINLRVRTVSQTFTFLSMNLFSPFTGVGSEHQQSIDCKQSRCFIDIFTSPTFIAESRLKTCILGIGCGIWT